MSVGRWGIRPELMLEKSLSMTVVTPVSLDRSMMVTAGCVVVLVLVGMGAHVPPAATLQVPAGEPNPQSASTVHAMVHAPLVQTDAGLMPVHCAVAVQAPFWTTPSGPLGEEQVLVA